MEAVDPGVPKAIMVKGLTKYYGDTFKAVDNISFEVEEGEIFGLLGPNGAGKTTTIKILTTLIKASSGAAEVFGINVAHKAQEVRQTLGYVPQAVSVDGDLSAYENLLIFSKLFYVSKKDRDSRISAALEYMELSERKDDLVKHFSGGMMRRLEIAQALVNRPKLLIFDEPSIGLDPSSRRHMWEYIKRLNQELQTTVLITTHDMLEADELCDRVAIMNRGKISVIGNPKELKHSVGGEIISVTLSKKGNVLNKPSEVVFPPELGNIVSQDGQLVKILTDNGEHAIPRIIEYYEQHALGVESIALSKPTLDDVFMKYAKTTLEGEGSFSETRSLRRTFARRSG